MEESDKDGAVGAENGGGGGVGDGSGNQSQQEGGREGGQGALGDGDDDDAVSAPIHPLLIVDILEVVFKHIVAQPLTSKVAKDVRSIRLVSGSWRDAVTPLYRRKRPPTYIGAVTYVDPTNHSNLIEDTSAVERFLETMENSPIIPVQSFVIHYNLYATKNQELVQKILRTCGHEVVSLRFDAEHLGAAVEPSGDNDCWGLSDLNLPKLKTLELECFAGCGTTSRTTTMSTQLDIVTEFLGVLFNAAKELNQFKIDSYYIPRTGSPDSTAFQQFENTVYNGLPPTVKIFKLDLFISNSKQAFQKLTETGLKLEEFDFRRCCTVDKQSFCKFLESQSGTLKVLKICHGYKAPDMGLSWEFPRMEELQRLDAIDIITDPLSFAETFPKVDTLDLTYWEAEEPFLKLLESVEKTRTAPAVKTIHMPYAFDLASHIKRMSKCFPNTSALILHSTSDIKETLREVFTYFTDLERLEIMFPGGIHRNADSYLSGVPKAECKRISEDELWLFQDINIQELQKKPSILNLTKLKKLVLMKENPLDRILLTDFSAHYLFLKMPSLEELSTYRSLLSIPYEEMLGRRLKLSVTDDGEWDRSSESSDGFDDSDVDVHLGGGEDDDDDDEDDDDDDEDDDDIENFEEMLGLHF